MAFRETLKDVFGNSGFSRGKLCSTDLNLFRAIIVRNYERVLNANLKHDKNRSSLVPITHYHEISHQLNHSQVWEKKNRILPEDDLKIARETIWLQTIKEEIGNLNISSEEGSAYGEITWRLVRPHPFKDVAPFHKDGWFWDLGHGITPEKNQRVKIWVSLYQSGDKTGFCYVEGSHKEDFEYEKIYRNGICKPNFDIKKSNLKPTSFLGEAGDFIIFNDRLLHTGEPVDNSTRVSFEFTLFLPQSLLSSIISNKF